MHTYRQSEWEFSSVFRPWAVHCLVTLAALLRSASSKPLQACFISLILLFFLRGLWCFVPRTRVMYLYTRTRVTYPGVSCPYDHRWYRLSLTHKHTHTHTHTHAHICTFTHTHTHKHTHTHMCVCVCVCMFVYFPPRPAPCLALFIPARVDQDLVVLVMVCVCVCVCVCVLGRAHGGAVQGIAGN